MRTGRRSIRWVEGRAGGASGSRARATRAGARHTGRGGRAGGADGRRSGGRGVDGLATAVDFAPAVVLLAMVLAACRGADGGAASPEPRPGPVVRIDGTFHDWRGVPPTRGDAPPPAAGPHGLGDVRVTHDALSVYLLLDFPTPVNLQGLDGALALFLDADGDAETGSPMLGVPGTDLVVSFTRLAGDGPRHGVAVWPSAPGDSTPFTLPRDAREPHALGVWFEPRHTSDRVEIRLSRAARLDVTAPHPFRGGWITGRVVRVDAAGHEITRSERFTHALTPAAPDATLDDPAWPSRPADVADLGRTPGSLRVVSWNVSRSRFLADPAPVRAILAALDPDLVLLDEVPPEATGKEVSAILPAREGRPWSVHVGTSGAGQRGAIAARGAVRPAPEFENVPLPDSVRGWLDQPASADLEEVRRNLDGGGVPATGARVETDDRNVLAITVDLVCCGNSAAAVEDRIRRIEAEAVNRAARGALAAARAAGDVPELVLLGGDFNLVGSRRPLDTAADGLGPDGLALTPVSALQLDGASNATWDGGGGPFPPGQLDYILYGGAGASVAGAFVFETRDLGAAALDGLGLDAGSSARASDHLPIVADFVWR